MMKYYPLKKLYEYSIQIPVPKYEQPYLAPIIQKICFDAIELLNLSQKEEYALSRRQKEFLYELLRKEKEKLSTMQIPNLSLDEIENIQKFMIQYFTNDQKSAVQSIHLLCFEHRCKEYINQMKMLERFIRWSDHCLFSDGIQMSLWYQKNKTLQENLSLEERTLFQQIEKVYQDLELKNSRRKKVRQMVKEIEDDMNLYLLKRKQGHQMQQRGVNFFPDGRDMFLWFSTLKDNAAFQHLPITKKKDFYYKVHQVEESYTRLFHRVDVYINQVLQKKTKKQTYGHLLFDDGVLMEDWRAKMTYQNKKRIAQNQEFTGIDIQKAYALALIDNAFYDFSIEADKVKIKS